MKQTKAAVAEIKARGQLTIPKKIREMSQLEEGDVVCILPAGDSLIVTPGRLELDEARKQLKKLVKASGLTLEELVRGIKEERAKLFKETYGAGKKV